MKRLGIFLTLFLAGCSVGPEMTSFFQKEKVTLSDLENNQPATTVSMILPLSGNWAATGEGFQKAALLALDDSPNASVRVLFFDTKSSSEGTKQAYNLALAQNSDIILGPIFADEFKGLPEPSLMNKPVLGYTSDSTLLNSERASFAVLIPEQIHEIVRQNCLSGKHNLAVIGPEGKTGEIVMNALEEVLPLCPDMTLKNYALYSSEKVDMSEDIKKMLPTFVDPKKKNLTEREKELLATPMQERLSFDSLLVFEEGTKLTQVMSILAFYDVTPKVVPIYTLANAKALKDNSLNGVLMADLPADNSFTARYKEAFGKQPLRLASLAYDSVGWIAQNSKNGIVSLQTLRDSDGYWGTDGLIRLEPNGTNKRALRLVQKTARGVREISPAPSNFEETNIFSLFMPTTESIDSASMSLSESDESRLNFE